MASFTQLQRSNDPTWLITNSYDALGRLVTEGQPFGSTSYLYDAAGDRTRITWGDGFYAGYAYDTIGNVTSINENGAISGVGVLASYSYDNLGRRTAVAYGNGTGRAYAYDPVGRLAGLQLTFPNAASNEVIPPHSATCPRWPNFHRAIHRKQYKCRTWACERRAQAYP